MTGSQRRAALVTGAAHGIGRAIALALAEAGYDITINDLPEESTAAQEVKTRCCTYGVRAETSLADLRSCSAIRELFAVQKAHFDRLDLLVNNAGIGLKVPFLETSEEQYDAVMETNLKAVFFCTQEAAAMMIEKGLPGVVINTTSINATIHIPHNSVYGPSKAALEKFTRHTALELAAHHIRVNAVAPGCVRVRPGQDTDPRGKMLSERIPTHRYGMPREVAQAVVFLASEQAAYITGASLVIDGGASLISGMNNPAMPLPPPTAPSSSRAREKRT